MSRVMSQKGAETRERILDTAQELILDSGYAGVSVDAIIRQLGLTKGAFFHHFKNKNDMALALIQRYADEGIEMFSSFLARANKLSDDPLQRICILVGLYEEMFEGLSEPYPGCLLASYIYELQQFNEETRIIINREFLLSRKALSKLIKQAMKIYPPKEKLDAASLADGLMVCFEGAFILSKSLRDPDITVKQLRHYKTYIRLLFNQG
jgi:TetR/AcrR family transcriptional repressor of nem operon